MVIHNALKSLFFKTVFELKYHYIIWDDHVDHEKGA